jgi:hypothetical protein
MPGLHASAITNATLRIAGEIRADINVAHLGTPEQEASLRIGELLIYLRDPSIAVRVGKDCARARTHTAILPQLAGASRLHLPVRVGVVGLVIRLGGAPRTVITGVPARPGVAVPPHVRVEIGPVTFEVCDQVAWWALGRAWALLARALTTEE